MIRIYIEIVDEIIFGWW